MRVAGIDPGITGAVAFMSDASCTVVDLPVGPLGIDPVAFKDFLVSWGPDRVILEDNRAMGGNGSLANWSMGYSMGLLIATITLCSYPLYRVKPYDWQRGVGMGTVPKTERKDLSRQRAAERWPHLYTDLSRKKDHNRADALWIAHYGRTLP